MPLSVSPAGTLSLTSGQYFSHHPPAARRRRASAEPPACRRLASLGDNTLQTASDQVLTDTFTAWCAMTYPTEGSPRATGPQMALERDYYAALPPHRRSAARCRTHPRCQILAALHLISPPRRRDRCQAEADSVPSLPLARSCIARATPQRTARAAADDRLHDSCCGSCQ